MCHMNLQTKAITFQGRHIEFPISCEEYSLHGGKSKPKARAASAAISSVELGHARKETERTNRESRAVCGAHVSITWALPDEERQRLPVTEGR